MSTSGHRGPAEDRRCYCLSSATSRTNIVAWHWCLLPDQGYINDVVVECSSRHSLHLLLYPIKACLVFVVTRYTELPVGSFLASSKSLDGCRKPGLIVSGRGPLRRFEVSHNVLYF